MGPDYTGSDDYEVNPFPLINISYGDRFFIGFPRGIGVNVIRGKALTAGIALGYGGGREDEGDLAPLEEVDAGAIANLFADYQLGPVKFSASLRSALSGDTEGEQASLGMSYGSTLGEKWVYSTKARLQWSSDDWNDALFSLSADQASLVGVASYTAQGGLSKVGLNTSLTYLWTEDWSMTAVASISQLLGDAADSPIVNDLGDATQLSGALLLGYRF